MTSLPSLASRIRGSIYGVAAGDALGGPVEFRNRGSFPPVTKYRYNAQFDLPPGSWTDDTSMTLCLAKSLVDKKGNFNILDQVNNYVKWFKEGYLSSSGTCFDIGNATRISLSVWQGHLSEGNADAEARGQLDVDAALDQEQNCGNGSLMRTAPIALVYHAENEQLLDDYTSRAGKVTHPHATCIESCQVYVRMISAMLKNRDGQISKRALFEVLRTYNWKSDILKFTFGKYRTLDDIVHTPESVISSSGFVVHTLEAALWAFFTTENFRDGVLKVVNLGDDADTVGAVYGGFAGAYYGFDDMPEDWVKGLQKRGMIDEVIDGLVKLTAQE